MTSIFIKEVLEQIAPGWRWFVGVQEGSTHVEGGCVATGQQSIFNLTPKETHLDPDGLKRNLFLRGIKPFNGEGNDLEPENPEQRQNSRINSQLSKREF
jgi:hypothetical protein